MSEKRRQYTDEFKREAVRLVTDHDYGATEAARCHAAPGDVAALPDHRTQYRAVRHSVTTDLV